MRALVLAGGTMEPLPVLRDSFFPRRALGALAPWRFSCGHVIDARAQMRCVALTRGPSGLTLDFRAQVR